MYVPENTSKKLVLESCHRSPDMLQRVLNRRYPTQLRESAHPCKLENSQNMGELQQPRKKTVPPFRRTMINS